MNRKKLTVFTPTYNRAYCLPALYASLLSQTYLDFVWLVVDDGSTDKTKALIDSWIKDGHIEIRYFYQDNAGKMAAHNRGVKECGTELFLCLDSDDYLEKEAVYEIVSCWEKYRKSSLAGIVAPRKIVNIKGDKIDKGRFNCIGGTATLRELYVNGFRGETALVFRTDVLRQYPFPVIEGEKFIFEIYVYNQIDACYKLKVLDKEIMICRYREDGYTHNMKLLMAKNPKGMVLMLIQQLGMRQSLYCYLRLMSTYIAYSLLGGYKLKRIVKDSDNCLICMLLFPIGFIQKLKISKRLK